MADRARVYMQLSRPGNQRIDGGSVVAGLKGWIEIEEWDWALRKNTQTGASSSIEPAVFSFSKLMDSATPTMLEAMSKGELLTAKLKMDDASLVMLNLVITLKDVRVISYDMKVDSGDKQISIGEDWEFNYESVLFDYKPDLKSGTMSVELFRPPGASVDSPGDKEGKFFELAKDMKVEELDKVWGRLRKRIEDEAKKPQDEK